MTQWRRCDDGVTTVLAFSKYDYATAVRIEMCLFFTEKSVSIMHKCNVHSSGHSVCKNGEIFWMLSRANDRK